MTLHISARQKLQITFAEPVAPVPTSRDAPVQSTRQETSDSYDRVLFLSPDRRLRIIVCRDDRQWIAQTRRPFTSKSDGPWSARGFCTSKLGLKRSLGKDRIAATPGMWRFIESLPNQFVRGTVNE